MPSNLVVTKPDCHQIQLPRNLGLTKAGCQHGWMSPNLGLTKAGCHQIWMSPNLCVTECGCHQIWVSPRLIVTQAVSPPCPQQPLSVSVQHRQLLTPLRVCFFPSSVLFSAVPSLLLGSCSLCFPFTLPCAPSCILTCSPSLSLKLLWMN